MKRLFFQAILCVLLCAAIQAGPKEGNRLTYLDELNPYYPHRDFPKLITPQWVGEEGVECVVVLAIDDMRDPRKYEEYLRPILIRLKQIDGRAPVSIMTCNVDPKDEQLQQWLAEGLSIEVHTVDHPCPLLQGGDFAKAKSTYDRCVDLLNRIPGNRPVAYRMPCCDSLNTVSPRFYAEIFNKTTENGNHLQISSSVFNVYTSDDPEIPRELVLDADGGERFKKLIPKNLNRNGMVFNTFVNTIENYPYPYVIGNLCWEFPCMVPSDWSAQHFRGTNNPQTVEDLKAALDITVHKKGVFNLVFHPHGWIRSDQVVELIDHAVEKHGKKVKFLTFKEAVERLNTHLFSWHGTDGLRRKGKRNFGKEAGEPNSVLTVDIDNDGHMDTLTLGWVIQGGSLADVYSCSGYLWSRKTGTWRIANFTIFRDATQGNNRVMGLKEIAQPCVVHEDGVVSLLFYDEITKNALHFDGHKWISDPRLSALLETAGDSIPAKRAVPERGVRFRDLDGDGIDEFVIGNGKNAVYRWSAARSDWSTLPFKLPAGVSIVMNEGRDAGLRFVDINEDGFDDIVFSNHERYGVWLFRDMQSGWSIEVYSGERGEKEAEEELPPIVREDGTNNGFFVHSRHLFWQNEDTADLPDLVERRSFDELLKNIKPAAKSPEMSLRSIEVREGFTVELVAAEPLVKDPVAFEWGADGKLWVAEMADYPVGTENGGRVRYLEDSDGDGKYDKSTLFLDGLNFPNGVMPWRNGVLITAAPDILYAEDTDGDGRADVRKVLFTGFGQGNQQHRASGLVYGLDNRLYCANGDSGGRIKSTNPTAAGKVTDISGRDFRINPETGELDPQTGRTQFGRHRDNWGNWFGCNNSNPHYHFVLADEYLRRNPHVRFPDPVKQVSETPGAAACYPVSRAMARFNDYNKMNRFTSACGTMIYRDELFGEEFAGNSFVSEPVHNLVHREIVMPEGVTFTSRRAEEEQRSEFLASRDNWFRPTLLKTGPDGALYIADMYRLVIEHPQYIPKELQEGWDLRAGEDRGRFYRVYPKGKKLRPVPRLDKRSTAELVAALESPFSWQRDTVQRLLVHRQDKAAIGLLERLTQGSKQPLARLHALCTLDGLEALSSEMIGQALGDPHPGVRRHAVRLSERLLRSPAFGKSRASGTFDSLLELADDPDPHVRMQLAYSLGEWDDERSATALAVLLRNSGGDRYLAAAVMSSVNEQNLEPLLAEIFDNQNTAPESDPVAVKPLFRLAGAIGNEATLVRLLQITTQPDKHHKRTAVQMAATAQLLSSMQRRGITLDKLFKAGGEREREVHANLQDMFSEAHFAATGMPEGKTEAERLAAIELLPLDISPVITIMSLSTLLRPQEPGKIQSAAVAALGRIDDSEAPGNLTVPLTLLSGWKIYGPGLRSEVLDVYLSRDRWAEKLLEYVGEGWIAPAEIDASHRQRLLSHKRTSLRKKAEKVFAGSIDRNRQAVLDAYRSALTIRGDNARGRQVFAKNCASCHKLEGSGHEVGPDLAALKDKSPEALLVAILDPNRNVESKYLNYVAVTADGRSYNGLLANETGNSITLLAPEGKKQVILRSELEELTSTAKSTMPEGLEKDLRPQDTADVMAYLASIGEEVRPNGRFPRTIRPNSDGTIELAADNCEIYGPSLVLEEKYNNLGYWESEQDRAIWPIHVPQERDYAVHLEWACPPENAGNSILFRCGTQRLTAEVESTGGWDSYRETRVGTIHLPQGSQRFEVRAAGALNGYLLDLKNVKLVPDEK